MAGNRLCYPMGAPVFIRECSSDGMDTDQATVTEGQRHMRC